MPRQAHLQRRRARNSGRRTPRRSPRPAILRATAKTPLAGLDARSPPRPPAPSSRNRPASPGVRTVTRASGRPASMACTAGAVMTASPSQFVERIRMRNGFSCCGREAARAASRRACRGPAGNSGRGVFQRLWTQNQSRGESADLRFQRLVDRRRQFLRRAVALRERPAARESFQRARPGRDARRSAPAPRRCAGPASRPAARWRPAARRRASRRRHRPHAGPPARPPPALPQELDGRGESAPAVERDNAKTGAHPLDMLVEMSVPERLVERCRCPCPGGRERGQLREQFPIPRVGDHQHDPAALLGNIEKSRPDPQNRTQARDFLRAQRGDLDGRKQVRAQRGEMLPRQRAQVPPAIFPRRRRCPDSAGPAPGTAAR